MNLERILAENMLRFGVKNLTDAAKSKLNEQAKPSIRQEAQNAASAGLPIVWVKNFEETKNVLNTIPVSAQFYNNMVTMETGMLPAGKKAFTDGLATAAQNILSANPDTVRITITGQATNLAPKKQGYNWATKQTMPLDHDYDKIDIEQNPQAGNIVLATKRAETAEKELVKLLGGKVPDLAKKITLKNKLVDGSLSADEQRKVIIEVSAATITIPIPSII